MLQAEVESQDEALERLEAELSAARDEAREARSDKEAADAALREKLGEFADIERSVHELSASHAAEREKSAKDQSALEERLRASDAAIADAQRMARDAEAALASADGRARAEAARAEEAARRVSEVEGELRTLLAEMARVKKAHADKLKNVTRALGLGASSSPRASSS